MKIRINITLIIILGLSALMTSCEKPSPPKDYFPDWGAVSVLKNGEPEMFRITGKVQLWIKAGGGYFGQFRRILNIADDSMISANIEPKIMIGSGRNQLELGLGYLFVYWFDITECEPKLWTCHEYSHIIFPRIGYRHYSRNQRWVFSLGWTPAYETYIDYRGDYSGEIIPVKTKGFHWLYGGIGIGWRF